MKATATKNSRHTYKTEKAYIAVQVAELRSERARLHNRINAIDLEIGRLTRKTTKRIKRSRTVKPILLSKGELIKAIKAKGGKLPVRAMRDVQTFALASKDKAFKVGRMGPWHVISLAS